MVQRVVKVDEDDIEIEGSAGGGSEYVHATRALSGREKRRRREEREL
jgi:hypothetical protein